MSEYRELSKKYYHLRNILSDIILHSMTALDELRIYDSDSADTILDDIEIIIEEAKANDFIDS